MTNDTRTEVFGPDRGQGATRPNVGKASLHRPTGASSIGSVHAHHDGGPIAIRGSRLFDALTPEPLPEGYPDDAGRTEADVEAALAERGWRPVTRRQAATLLRLDGYPLGTDRAPGHILYADQADATVWAPCCSSSAAVPHPAGHYTRETFVARDGGAQGTPTPGCCVPSRLGVATLDVHRGRAHLAALAVHADGSTHLHAGHRLLERPGPGAAPSAGGADQERIAAAQGDLAERGWFPVTRAQVAAMLAGAGADAAARRLLRLDPVDDATWHPSDRDPRVLRTLVAYRGTPAPTYDQQEQATTRPAGGYLSDELLARIGVDQDAEFEEPFEDETLRWLAETVNDARRIALRDDAEWDGPDEHFALPYAPLGVRDVAMLADALDDDPVLVLTWRTDDGVALCSRTIHPEELLGEHPDGGYLRGYTLGRHAVMTAYTLIDEAMQTYHAQHQPA